jgi:eukaryotic-like serine/threonine-protein kinase
MPPKVIGPYRVLEALGSGGVGTVYRARNQRSGETVALKLLSTGPALDPRAARRLAREFEALADLSHPNVVKVFETGVFQGYPYLTMELVEGLTLRHYLALAPEDGLERPMAPKDPPSHSPPDEEVTGDWDMAPFSLAAFAAEMPSEEGGPIVSGPDSIRALADVADEPDTHPSQADTDLPFDVHAAIDAIPNPPNEKPPSVNLHQLNRAERVGRLKDAMLQLCRALSYIHGHGLVHRDLKPSNVMVDEDRQVRLMDFGLAKFLADDASVVTGDGRLVGTFRYMSPEQIMGEPVDARADLYSLGVILYELLSGRSPFDGKTPYELWQKVVETDAPFLLTLNPLADTHLVRIAHRLIRKDPEERFQTAEEVFEALSE